MYKYVYLHESIGVCRASTIRVEGPNEERIENDLWGVCRCWRNNIIVNFADCGIVRVQGGGFIEQTRE